MKRTVIIDSPAGPLVLVWDGDALAALTFDDGRPAPPGAAAGRREERPPAISRAVRQLEEYFAGRRRSFDIPHAPRGTPFQKRVWEALRRIPYGETATYGGIALAIGAPAAARAVGAACARNPLAIVVPCHRVVGAGGRLTGYAGGLARKQALLDLEAANRRRTARAPR